MELPRRLAAHWRTEPAWLDVLPGLVADCAEPWELELEPPIDTPHSLVVPAGDVVLKLNAPSHVEADQEPDALVRARAARTFASAAGQVRSSRFGDALTEIGFDRERLRGWGVAHALAWGWDESGWSAESIAVARLIRDAT